MLTGIFAGITWAVETVVIGIALSMTPFVSSEEGAFLAPFVSTFLHDSVSSLFMWIYNAIRGKTKEVLKLFKTKSFIWLVVASAIGGPCGMTGYVLAVSYMGASIGAVASAVYPAIGSVLAFFFLKEKVKWYQWIFLVITLLGVFGLGYSPEMDIKNFWLGLVGILMCALGWGIEGVILSGCFKNGGIKSEYALQIRQTVSALLYGAVILPILSGWRFTAGLFVKENADVLLTVALAAVFASISYLLYYRAISSLGVSKAMGLNITYTAWAMIIEVVFLKRYGLLSPLTVGCAAIVVLCGIFAATDIKALKTNGSKL